MHQGEIIEQGPHEELLKLNGAYHDLWSKQFMTQKADKDGEALINDLEPEAPAAEDAPGHQPEKPSEETPTVLTTEISDAKEFTQPEIVTQTEHPLKAVAGNVVRKLDAPFFFPISHPAPRSVSEPLAKGSFIGQSMGPQLPKDESRNESVSEQLVKDALDGLFIVLGHAERDEMNEPSKPDTPDEEVCSTEQKSRRSSINESYSIAEEYQPGTADVNEVLDQERGDSKVDEKTEEAVKPVAGITAQSEESLTEAPTGDGHALQNQESPETSRVSTSDEINVPAIFDHRSDAEEDVPAEKQLVPDSGNDKADKVETARNPNAESVSAIAADEDGIHAAATTGEHGTQSLEDQEAAKAPTTEEQATQVLEQEEEVTAFTTASPPPLSENGVGDFSNGRGILVHIPVFDSNSLRQPREASGSGSATDYLMAKNILALMGSGESTSANVSVEKKPPGLAESGSSNTSFTEHNNEPTENGRNEGLLTTTQDVVEPEPIPRAMTAKERRRERCRQRSREYWTKKKSQPKSDSTSPESSNGSNNDQHKNTEPANAHQPSQTLAAPIAEGNFADNNSNATSTHEQQLPPKAKSNRVRNRTRRKLRSDPAGHAQSQGTNINNGLVDTNPSTQSLSEPVASSFTFQEGEFATSNGVSSGAVVDPPTTTDPGNAAAGMGVNRDVALRIAAARAAAAAANGTAFVPTGNHRIDRRTERSSRWKQKQMELQKNSSGGSLERGGNGGNGSGVGEGPSSSAI